MAILAQLEVDDDGSLKIKNFRDALSDLGASVIKSKEQIEQANRSGTTSAKQQADAITQLTAAHRAALAEQQKYAQGFGVLQTQLKAGATVSDIQAKALQQLATQTQSNTQFTQNYGAALADLVKAVTAGNEVTVEQAAALQHVTKGYTDATTAVQQQQSAVLTLLTSIGQADAAYLHTAQTIQLYTGGLAALSTQLKAGQQATTEQVAAVKELAEAASRGNGFTAEQAKFLGDLNTKLQQGIPLTKEEAAQMAVLAEEYAVANREALGLGTAISLLIDKEQRAIALAREHAQAFQILSTQLKAGQQATLLQKEALNELATSIQVNKKFTEEQRQALQGLSAELQKNGTLTAAQATQLQQLNRAYQQSLSSTQEQTNAFQAFNVQAAATAAALALIAGGAYELLRTSGDLAARIETMGVVMGIVSKNAHLSSTEMLIQVEAIKKLGITTREANDSVLQFVQSNLKLSDASKLARAAQDLAVIAGENSSQTFQRLTRAIQTGETMLLRQVGIVTTNEAVWREYAKTIGKNVNQLDALDKKQAFVNKILVEAAKATGAYEASMTTAGKQMGSFTRFVEESELALGKALLPTMGLVVRTATEFLKVWLALPAPIQAAVTAILAAVAAMALLAGAIAGAKFVGLVGLVVSATTAFSTFFATVSAGTPVLAAASAVFGPWTLALTALTIALGVGVGAWVAWSNATSVSTQELQKNVAATIESKDAFDKLAKSALDLENKFASYRSRGIEPATMEQEKYREIAEKLLAISPRMVQVIDAETRTYRILTDQIKEATAAKEADVAASLKQLRANATRLREEADRVEDELRIKQDQLGRMQRGEMPSTSPMLVKGEVVGQIDLTKDLQKAVSELQTQLKELRANSKTAGDAMLDAMRRSLPASEQQVFAMREANKILTEYTSKLEGAGKSSDTFAVRLANAKKNNADLMAAIQKGPEGIQGFLSGIDQEWDKHLKKVEADTKKYNNAFESMVEKIRGTAEVSRAQFAAVNQELDKGKLAPEEYARRLVIAKDVILATANANPKLVGGLKNLQTAFTDLRSMEMETVLDKWQMKFREVGLAVEEVSKTNIRGLTDSFRDMAVGFDKKFTDMAIAQEDDLFEKRRDLYERNVVAKMREVDQLIYAEHKRVEDFIRAAEREKRARQDVITEERRAVAEKADLARRELEDTIRKATDKARAEIAALQTVRDFESNGNAEKIRLNHEAAQAAFRDLDLRLNTIREQGLEEIRLREDAQQGIVKSHQAAVDEMNAASDAQTNAQIADARRAAREIIKTHSEIRQFFKATATALAAQFTDGLLDIAKGTKSWKDLMVGIFESLRDSLGNIVKQMVANWIEGLFRMKAAQQGNGLPGGTNVGPGGGQFGAGGAGMTRFGGLFGRGLTTTQKAMGAAGLGMMAGGIAGQYADGSYAKGALYGAGAGALTGAAYGGWVGAGVGAAVGGISGYFQARSQRKEMQKDRDQLVKDMGGLDEFKRKAEEAGFAYEKLLATKSPKTFGEEVKKLQESLDKLDLKKSREELIANAGGMEALRKQMQLVGFQSDKLFNTENVSEYNREVERLNKLLDAQAKRLAGLGTAAQGLAAMVKGFAATIEKESKGRDAKETADAFRDDWTARFNTIGAVASAIFGRVLRETGDIVQAMQAIADPLDEAIALQEKFGFAAEGSFARLISFRNFIKVNEDIATSLSGITMVLQGLGEAGGLTADLFNAMGRDASQMFNMLLERGSHVDDALLLMQPTLQALWEAQKKFGFATDEATQKLIDQGIAAGIVGEQHQDVNQRILDTLLLIAEVLGADIPEAYRRTAAAATGAGNDIVDARERERMAIRENQQAIEDYAAFIDAAGGHILDEFGNVVGVVNDVGGSFERLRQRAREAEEAMRAAGRAGAEAGRATEEATTGAAEGHSPSGIKQIIVRAREAMAVFKTFQASVVQDSVNMEDAATSVSEKIALMRRMNKAGVDADSVAAIYRAAAEQNGGVDPANTDTVRRAPDGEGRVQPVRPEPVAITIQIKPTFEVNAIDAAGVEEATRERLAPEMLSLLQTNTDQMATMIEEALARVRRG